MLDCYCRDEYGWCAATKWCCVPNSLYPWFGGKLSSSISSVRQQSFFPPSFRPRFICKLSNHRFPVSFRHYHRKNALDFGRPSSLPEETTREPFSGKQPSSDTGDKFRKNQLREAAAVITQQNFSIIGACVVGLLTGIAVVLFNNAVHEIRDAFWDGIPYRGASWLRDEPIDEIWQRVIFVPVCGGLIVSMLNSFRDALRRPPKGTLLSNISVPLRQILKAIAASVTLGTGNSLGPEGPSVEIGASIAKGIGNMFGKTNQTRFSLLAAGSAAGVSAGFNAAVAGCFFAVESVLWPSPTNSSSSLTNTTSMVILSSVIASVVSEVGLGSEPAFKVPDYDFRSASELPLYLLLGILCGLVSLTLSRCTSYALVAVENIQKATGISRAIFPVMGGFIVGIIALAYPEILYWGFQNVDILLESRPFVKGLSADLLLQLVGAKIVATSLCRASGLVGGYYAPSLFIGAATGMAYGKFASYIVTHSDPIYHLSILEVASPQAYGLVGMAATLAGVCQVPLTAVLLLFELTQDYRIVLPLLGAVGFSAWIASGQTRERDVGDKAAYKDRILGASGNTERSSNLTGLASGSAHAAEPSHMVGLCELESSLCVDDSFTVRGALEEKIFVSQAMNTRYVAVLTSTLLTEAVTLMLSEKQSCAVVIDSDNFLVGFLTLGDIQEFSKCTKSRAWKSEKLLVSEICYLDGVNCRVSWTVTPAMDLLSALRIMNRYGMNQLPVVSEHIENNRGYPVGILERECISLTCRIVAIQELLSPSSIPEGN